MGAQPHIRGRRSDGGNVGAAPQRVQLGAQMRTVPFGEHIPVIDRGQQQRPHPRADLPQQPAGFLA